VIVAQHLEREEKPASPLPGHEVIKAEVTKDGLTPIELGRAYEAARAKGEHPYRDAIHPNPTGQKVMADVLIEAIESVVK
jgi:lysophospholipase L1-like esterase